MIPAVPLEVIDAAFATLTVLSMPQTATNAQYQSGGGDALVLAAKDAVFAESVLVPGELQASTRTRRLNAFLEQRDAIRDAVCDKVARAQQIAGVPDSPVTQLVSRQWNSTS